MCRTSRAGGIEIEIHMKLKSKVFRSGFSRWETAADEAADWVSKNLTTNTLVNISHCEDNKWAVIIVWYWA